MVKQLGQAKKNLLPKITESNGTKRSHHVLPAAAPRMAMLHDGIEQTAASLPNAKPWPHSNPPRVTF